MNDWLKELDVLCRVVEKNELENNWGTAANVAVVDFQNTLVSRARELIDAAKNLAYLRDGLKNGDCVGGCDSYGHADGCTGSDMVALVAKQAEENEKLRELLRSIDITMKCVEDGQYETGEPFENNSQGSLLAAARGDITKALK